VRVCVCVWTITFERNGLELDNYSVLFQAQKSGQSTRSHDEKWHIFSAMDACTENFVKFGHVAFEIRNGLTDIQTEIHRQSHRYTDTLIAISRSHTEWGFEVEKRN